MNTGSSSPSSCPSLHRSCRSFLSWKKSRHQPRGFSSSSTSIKSLFARVSRSTFPQEEYKEYKKTHAENIKSDTSHSHVPRDWKISLCHSEEQRIWVEKVHRGFEEFYCSYRDLSRVIIVLYGYKRIASRRFFSSKCEHRFLSLRHHIRWTPYFWSCLRFTFMHFLRETSSLLAHGSFPTDAGLLSKADGNFVCQCEPLSVSLSVSFLPLFCWRATAHSFVVLYFACNRGRTLPRFVP